MISQLDWLNHIDAQVNKFMKDNGGSTSNPLISLDAQNLKTLIGLARQGLNQGRPLMGTTTPEQALQHYQENLARQNNQANAFSANRQPQKQKEPETPALSFQAKPQAPASYLNAVMTKLSKDEH
jgi:hypothetical protein